MTRYAKPIAILSLTLVGLLSLSTMAGQDEVQRQIVQQAIKAKQKLKEAEAAKASERQRLMQEHLQMMKETLTEMRKLKPKDGMSAEEHKEWIATHQSLMEELMEQMMEEHHLMMGVDAMPAGMGDMHQH